MAVAAPRPDDSQVHAVAVAIDGKHHSIFQGVERFTCLKDLKIKSVEMADLIYADTKLQVGGSLGIRKRLASHHS